jgi:hypothetical protein
VLRIDRIVVELMNPGYQTVVYFSDGTFTDIDTLYNHVFINDEWFLLDKWNETPHRGD